MFKIKFLIYLTFFFLIYNKSLLSIENKILVKVENEIITTIDVENESRYLLSLNKNISNFSKQEIFEISKKSMIREKIKNIEIKKNFIDPKVPDNYLKGILKSVYQKIKIENLDNFKKYLKENNVDYNHVKKKLESEALWNELIIAKFSSKITIDKKEIRKRINVNNNKFSKSFLISEIFIENSNSNETQLIYDEIKKTIENESFEKAALTFSSSNTSSSGGNLGWIQEETLNEKLKNILSKMSENEITSPIVVPGGFMILKINQIKKEKKNQNIEQEVLKIMNIKKNNQLNQFSKMYFNKIKKNLLINEL